MSDTKPTPTTEQEPTSPRPEADEQSLMLAEYGVLCQKLGTVCNGSRARVAMAALISVAGTIAVSSCPNEVEARNYLVLCLKDVVDQMPSKFSERDALNGNDSGSPSQERH